MKHHPTSLPADFAERCRSTSARILAGEAMTYQYIADQLGIPFETFALCLGAHVVLAHGLPVLIDPTPLEKTH
jgi:hypothetical protein